MAEDYTQAVGVGRGEWIPGCCFVFVVVLGWVAWGRVGSASLFEGWGVLYTGG